jgi:uncharacterized protein YjbI with pentapeptide repeats
MPKTTFKLFSKGGKFYSEFANFCFDNCNLENAIFNDTQLKEVNFVTAYNYKIDPEFNPMKKAKFSTEEFRAYWINMI